METKKCIECGRERPISEFRKNYLSADGHTSVCNGCMSAKRREKKSARTAEGGGNPALAEFKSRELIEELRNRGYKGTLEYIHQITL